MTYFHTDINETYKPIDNKVKSMLSFIIINNSRTHDDMVGGHWTRYLQVKFN